MTSGPAHYREAERLLTGGEEQLAARGITGTGLDILRAYSLAAQAHATIALAAATALAAPVDGCEPGMLAHEMQAWEQAAGTPHPNHTEPTR